MPTRHGANSRGYTYAWQQARARYLRAHPLCAECRLSGTVAAADVVDHVLPHRGDQALFWDEGNWQPLCKECHDRKTLLESGRQPRKGLGCGADGMPRDPSHHWTRR